MDTGAVSFVDSCFIVAVDFGLNSTLSSSWLTGYTLIRSFIFRKLRRYNSSFACFMLSVCCVINLYSVVSLTCSISWGCWHQRADEKLGDSQPRYPGAFNGQRQGWKTPKRTLWQCTAAVCVAGVHCWKIFLG